MEFLIWVVIIIFVLIRNLAKQDARNRRRTGGDSETITRSTARQQPAPQRERRQMTEAERERLNQYRHKKNGENAREWLQNAMNGSSIPSRPARSSVVQSKPAASRQTAKPAAKPYGTNGTIVDRAKNNNARFGEDTTLQEIESLHGHSEHREPEAEMHSRNCQSMKNANSELMVDSYLGTTEDLIVKGYSGTMQFERDFVGEGLDMLNSFQHNHE